MINFTYIVAACAVLCAPAIAFAAQADPAPAKAKATSPDKLICRTEEDTGSRISKKKVCQTAAQWRDSSYRAGQWTEQRSTQLGKPGGS